MLSLRFSRCLLQAAPFHTGSKPSTDSNLNLNRVDQYDHKKYNKHRITTKVVIREKPFIQSRKERIWLWLAPSNRFGDSLVDGLQLGKMAVLICLPLFLVLGWKFTQKGAPAALEAKAAGFQNRSIIEEEESSASFVDYFTVIDKFQERREKALEKLKNAKSG